MASPSHQRGGSDGGGSRSGRMAYSAAQLSPGQVGIRHAPDGSEYQTGRRRRNRFAVIDRSSVFSAAYSRFLE